MYYKNKKRNNIKNYLIGGLSVALVGTIGTLVYEHSNKDNCNIPGRHSHLYVNSRRYSVYLDSESEKVNGFYKTNQFRLEFGDYDDLNFQKRLLEEGLVPIADNLDLIRYERETKGWENVIGYDQNGEPLTATAGFYAYKYDAETDSFVRSDYVSMLENIMDEYPYIKVGSFYDIVASSSITDNSLTYIDESEENIFDGESEFGEYEDESEYPSFFDSEDSDNNSDNWFDESEIPEDESDFPSYFDPDNPDNNSDLNPDNWFDEPIISDDGFVFLSNNKVKTKTLKPRNYKL